MDKSKIIDIKKQLAWKNLKNLPKQQNKTKKKTKRERKLT